MSHQIPDGDPAKILDRALDAELTDQDKQACQSSRAKGSLILSDTTNRWFA